MGMKDMFDSLRIISLKSSIFSTFTFVLIILALLFADTIIYNGSSDHHQLQTQISAEEIKVKSLTDEIFTETDEKFVRPESKFKHVEESELFESSDLSTKFDLRVKEFFRRNECKVKFFMTWIGPADSYREREFFGLETLFQTNPQSCLIIMSKSMDTVYGDKILEPLIGCGFRVLAVTPDLWGLFKKTPAETWLKEIRNGSRDPGQIPLPQNLSNLMRLAALYKYGGVYLDTDFVILRDFSVLKNVIGAQSVDIKGNWTRLNNAVLVFNRKHPLVYKFMEEFASTFDGNRWGHNGPYLVSRVVDRVATNEEFKFTILPPIAFYPVDWTRIAGYFARPHDPNQAKWADTKIRQLKKSSYGVHLWNRVSDKFKIEEGSIIDRLLNDHCVICSRDTSIS
ncbi:uncharacterized protein At4g19900-like [Primulina eburnea]|uniref:uncharacterized protein At4g19900-like n=1 Tax=Primulina eburnea TaxID=1245227 RepID=UPI003C6C1543